MRCQCIICTDHFDGAADIVSVPCGHTFHESCLLRWLKSNPSCPTCRVRVKSREVRRIYLLSLDDTMTVEDSTRIEKELSEVRIRNHELKQQLAKFEDGQEDLRSLVKTQGEELARYKHKYTSISKEIKTMKAKENCLKEELLKNAQLQEKIAELQDTIKKTKDLKAVLQGTTNDVEELMRTYGPGESSVRQIATYCVLIKRQLIAAKEQMKAARREALELPRQMNFMKNELAEKDRKLEAALADVAQYKAQCTRLANELENHPDMRPSGTKRRSDEVDASNTKRLRAEISLDISVVPSPPVLKQRPGFLKGGANSKSQLYPPAPAGYSKMKIVTGAKKPASKPKDTTADEVLLNLMKRTANSGDSQSKVRIGYNGLGGHSTHIQTDKKSIW